MIDQKFIDSIPEELNNGVKFICDNFIAFNTLNSETNSKNHNAYIEYYLMTEAFLHSKNFVFDPIVIGEDKLQNIKSIGIFLRGLRIEFDKRLTLDFVENSRSRFSQIFTKSFSYEFSQGDLDRIQGLINELREHISRSEVFTAEHKQRLLKRLEKLQSELHKKVSDLDRFWGLIGDAGVALGKFGKEAKPIVDRIREISEIVWRTQARSEELPSGTTTPFLPEKPD